MVNDRASVPAWRPLREPPLRKIALTLSLSAVVHLLLTPIAGLLGAFAWLLTPALNEDRSEPEQLRSIPITFLGYDDEEPAVEPSPLASAQPAERLSKKATAAPSEPLTQPTTPVAPPATPEKPVPPPPPPTRPARRGSEIKHPVAMAGVASEVVDSNANVNLLLLGERVRQHPLGERIGKLIVSFPQWSSFFASADIDPVRDIDRILIVGPQFRRSADVVAILQHRMPLPVVKEAVDRLVQRAPRGRWLTSKFPAARAHADRAERLFALTTPTVLVVAPPHLEKQILSAPPTRFPTPEGEEAVVLHVKTPWRALMGLPFSLPESLAWIRLDVLPLADGGAELRLTGEDADAEQARDHAHSLSLALNAVTNPDLGPLGALIGLGSIAFVDKIQFRARGRRISGEVHVTPRQLDRILSYTEELVSGWTGRRAQVAQPGAAPASRLPSSEVPPPNRPASAAERPAVGPSEP